jgi:hypothetical protein
MDLRRAHDHYRWAGRYTRLGDDAKANAHFGRALAYAGSAFGADEDGTLKMMRARATHLLTVELRSIDMEAAMREELIGSVSKMNQDELLACSLSRLSPGYDVACVMTAAIMMATGNTRAICLADVGSIVDGAAVFDGRAFEKGTCAQEMIVFTDFSAEGGDIDDAFALGALVHAATTKGLGLERLVVVLSARKKSATDTTTPARACAWLKLLFLAKGASVPHTDEELGFTCERTGGGNMRVDVCWDLGRTLVIGEADSKASIEERFASVATPTKSRVAAVVIGPISAATAEMLNDHLEKRSIALIVGVTVSGGVNGGESVTNKGDFLAADVTRACGGGKKLVGIVELNTAETRPLLMTRKFLANHGLLNGELLRLAHKSAWRAFTGFYDSNGSSADNGLMSFRLIASNGQSSAPVPVQQVGVEMTRVYLARRTHAYGPEGYHGLMPERLKSRYTRPYLPYLRIAELYVAMCAANLAFERTIPTDDIAWASVYNYITGASDDDARDDGPIVERLASLLSSECESNAKTRKLVGAAIEHVSSVDTRGAAISVDDVRAMYVTSVFVTYMRLLTAGTHLHNLGLKPCSIGRSALVSDGRTHVRTASVPFIVITPVLDPLDVR